MVTIEISKLNEKELLDIAQRIGKDGDYNAAIDYLFEVYSDAEYGTL